jgi:hypothetical protein
MSLVYVWRLTSISYGRTVVLRRERKRGTDEPPYVAAGKCFTGGDLLPLVPPWEGDSDCGEGGSCSNGICGSM